MEFFFLDSELQDEATLLYSEDMILERTEPTNAAGFGARRGSGEETQRLL